MTLSLNVPEKGLTVHVKPDAHLQRQPGPGGQLLGSREEPPRRKRVSVHKAISTLVSDRYLTE